MGLILKVEEVATGEQLMYFERTISYKYRKQRNKFYVARSVAEMREIVRYERWQDAEV